MDSFDDIRVEYGVNRFWEMAADKLLENDSKSRGYTDFYRYCRHYGIIPSGRRDADWGGIGGGSRRDISMPPESVEKIADKLGNTPRLTRANTGTSASRDRRHGRGRSSGTGTTAIGVESGWDR